MFPGVCFNSFFFLSEIQIPPCYWSRLVNPPLYTNLLLVKAEIPPTLFARDEDRLPVRCVVESMAAIGVHFGYTCACVAVFKVNMERYVCYVFKHIIYCNLKACDISFISHSGLFSPSRLIALHRVSCVHYSRRLVMSFQSSIAFTAYQDVSWMYISLPVK